MRKSYILKFDEVMGDYVIVEREGQQQNVTNQERGRSMFQGFNFFKNFKKENKNQEKAQEFNEKDENNEGKGFFEGIDNSLKKNQKEKIRLGEELKEIEKLRQEGEVEINAEENNSQNPNNGNPVTPQPTTPQPTTPTTPSNPSPSNNGTSVNEGIELLANLYNNFRILGMIYQNLRDINPEYAQTFSDFIADNRGLQGGILNIFFEVSSQNNPPRQTESVPTLSSEFLDIVDIASSFVQGMREINLRLKRIFNVVNFNRQFDLIENTLSLQNNFLSNLRIQNMSIKIKEINN